MPVRLENSGFVPVHAPVQLYLPLCDAQNKPEADLTDV